MAYPKGHMFMRLRDEVGMLLVDEDFVQLYAARGQPGVAPWKLTLVTLMQFVENLSDRQAADAVQGHLAWKYALSLELGDPGFDATVLSEFRTRFLRQDNLLLLLDRFLARCQELGMLRPHGKQRTDSTHVLAAIRVMNRLELVTETLRAALNMLAELAPAWLKQVSDPAWYDRYAHRAETYRLPKSEAAKRAYAACVGRDGQTLLELLQQSEAPQGALQLPEILVLQRCWASQFLEANGALRFKEREELSPSVEAVESPYDPEARFGTKRGQGWIGYKVHLTETCEDDLPRLLTHVTTTLGNMNDAPIGLAIQTQLFQRNLSPQQHWLDAGYNGADLIVAAREQHGTQIIGPVRLNNNWSGQQVPSFDLRSFEIQWHHQQVVCPRGQTSVTWTQTVRENGQAVINARFAKAICRACPVRAQCIRSGDHPKSLKFQPQAQQEALYAARDAMNDPLARQLYQRRAGIEGTISQGVRTFGLRRCRYIGEEKTRLQHVLTAMAINVARLDAWMTGERPIGTKPSRFARLQAA